MPANMCAQSQMSDADLPEGWCYARVQDVFDSFGGGTPNRATAAYWGGNIPWLSSGDIKRDRIDTASEFITQSGLANSSASMCRRGSVVVVVRSGILAHTLPIALVQVDAAINQDIKCFDCGNDRLNAWLALALRHRAREILLENREGTTVQSVKYDTLKQFRLAVPPPEEQSRIMAKIAVLEKYVETARRHLRNVPKIVSHFRLSVLAAAASGRLTEDWREQHPEIASAATLLKNLAELRKTDKVPAATPTQADGELADLPDSWEWVRFGDVIGELRNGISTRPDREPPGNPILRISSVRGGAVALDDVRFLPKSDDLIEVYGLRDGDLLFTRYNGSLEFLGVCGMVRGLAGRRLLYPDKLMRVRFDHSFVLPAYAELMFQCPAAREKMVAKAKSSAGQQGISGADVKAQLFPLCPLEEQLEVLRRTEALLRLADKVESRANAASVRVEKLIDSALSRAFRGELVETEASRARSEGRDFESAGRFLERIMDSSVSKRDPAKRERSINTRLLKAAASSA